MPYYPAPFSVFTCGTLLLGLGTLMSQYVFAYRKIVIFKNNRLTIEEQKNAVERFYNLLLAYSAKFIHAFCLSYKHNNSQYLARSHL